MSHSPYQNIDLLFQRKPEEKEPSPPEIPPCPGKKDLRIGSFSLTKNDLERVSRL